MDSQESNVTEKSLQIPFGDKTFDAILTQPVCDKIKSHTVGGVILTHDAGGDMNTAQLVQLANHLAAKGFACARFTCRALNLKYRIKVYKAIVDHFIQHEGWHYCIIGGRSMGARAAVSTANESQFPAGKQLIKGVICLSYPLHPPKDVSKLRNDIFQDAKLPILFISGTEDVQCEQKLMKGTLSTMENVTMNWLEGGNHGLHVKGQVDSVTNDRLCQVVSDWCKTNIMQKIDSKDMLNKVEQVAGQSNTELAQTGRDCHEKKQKAGQKRVARQRQRSQNKKKK